VDKCYRESAKKKAMKKGRASALSADGSKKSHPIK
jgi:hypothetical protein